MGSWWEQEAEALALPCDPVLSAPRQHGLTRPPLTRWCPGPGPRGGQSGSPAPASWSCSVIGQAAPSGSLSLQKEPRAKMGAGVRLRKLQGTVQAGAASSAPGPDLEPPASTWLTATLLLPSPQAWRQLACAPQGPVLLGGTGLRAPVSLGDAVARGGGAGGRSVLFTAGPRRHGCGRCAQCVMWNEWTNE